MTLRIAGTTSGYVEVDCAATGGNNTIVLPSTNGSANQLLKNGSTAGSLEFSSSVYIDSSQRLLVGTSSASRSGTLFLQGSSAGATGDPTLVLARGLNNPSDGATLGALVFTDSGHGDAAQIYASRDGGTWNTSTSRPTRLVFSTCADGASNPTERMRIGNLGINFRYSAGANVDLIYSASAAGTTDNLIVGHYGATGVATGTSCFFVRTNGNVLNVNNSYAGTSDLKLKENIVDATSQWSDIKALQVRKYNFKEGQTHTQIGLVAQEVELVSPGLVSESPDRDEEGNDLGTVTKSVNYSVLYMKAVKALQEAIAKIETLEAANAALDARLTALEAQS